MDYADVVESNAHAEFGKYVSNMDAFNKLDGPQQYLLKLFFVGGFLKGVQSTFPKLNKENTSERIEPRTVAE